MAEKIITLKDAKAEAKEMYWAIDMDDKSAQDCKDFIDEYINSLKADGYVIK